MATEITVGIAGAAGDGLDRTGDTLARTAARLGLHLYTYNSYQSLIRGGHTWLRLRLSEAKVDNHGDHLNVLMALGEDGFERHAREVEPGGAIVYNSARFTADPVLVPKGVTLVPLPVPELIAPLGQAAPRHAEHGRPRGPPAPGRPRPRGHRGDPAGDLQEEGAGDHRAERGRAEGRPRVHRAEICAPLAALEVHPQATTGRDRQPHDGAGGGGGRLQVLLRVPHEPRLLHPPLAGLPQRAGGGAREAGRGRARGGEPRHRRRARGGSRHVRDLGRGLRPHERGHRHGGDDRDPGGGGQRAARRPLHRPSHQDRAGRPEPGLRRLPGRLSRA